MAVKRTYFHRDFAIVHRTFASEHAEEIIELFVVNRVGDTDQLFSKPTLEEARMAVDELMDSQSAWRTGSRAMA